jgi:hypothetical protein
MRSKLGVFLRRLFLQKIGQLVESDLMRLLYTVSQHESFNSQQSFF